MRLSFLKMYNSEFYILNSLREGLERYPFFSVEIVGGKKDIAESPTRSDSGGARPNGEIINDK